MKGQHKKQEITRLLYEISKRESTPPENIIRDINPGDFSKIKDELLKTYYTRRFPYAYLNDEICKPYLPKLKFDPSPVLNQKKSRFYPKKIFIETAAWRSRIANRFRKYFPDANLSGIRSLKDYLKKHRHFTIEDYNNRSSTIFITKENHDFFKTCPCTKKAVRCGYNIFNLSFGCMFGSAFPKISS